MWVIKKIHNQFNKSNKNSAHPVVFSLAPNVPEIRSDYLVYKSYLDAALSDNSIWNIAITGNYGIGKSSFLKWYTGQKKYLFVSLCDFTHDNEKKSINELGCDVCRQLLIGCSKAQRRRNKYHFIGVFILTFLLCTFIAYYLLVNNIFGSFNAFNVILDKLPMVHPITADEIISVKFVFDLVGGITGLLGVPFLITWLVSAISISKFSFKAKDIEAEMEFENSKSIHFMDLLKVKLIDKLRKAARQYDYTVIFEDFDRTDYDNCISLFNDLREINRLINYSTSGYFKKPPVRFIYVLQDDLFVADKKANDSDRMVRSLQLKFFDIIIPFIPGIYGNASADYIHKCLKAVNVCDKCSREFIKIAGGYLYDYRTINSIANEYQIIKDVFLSTSERNSNEQQNDKSAKKSNDAVDDNSLDRKILSLAAYKTLMPDDYAHIRTGESLLFDIGFESTEESKIDPCVFSLWKQKWLDWSCLEFVGLNTYVINRYISGIINAETSETFQDLDYWIERIYPLWRRALLEDTDLLDKALKKLAYSLLCAELKNNYSDYELIHKALARELNWTKENFKTLNFGNRIYPLIPHEDEKLKFIVKYLLKFGCNEWLWLFNNNMHINRFLICLNLSSDMKRKLFETAKEPITNYINCLEGEKLNELIHAIDRETAELIYSLPIDQEIQVAIEKSCIMEVDDG